MARLTLVALAILASVAASALDSLPEPVTGPVEVERMYFIDPANGDDDADGLSREAAWRTLAKANATLTAGEGVTLLAGEYTDGRIDPADSGEEDRPIVYQGEPGAVVRATSVRADPPVAVDGVITIAQDWIVVQDLEIDANRWGLPVGARLSCATIDGDHNILRRLDMHDANGTGVWMFGDRALPVGEDAPAIIEAEALPFYTSRPEGNWRRPVAPERGGEGIYQTVAEPWGGTEQLMREHGANELVAQIISNPFAEDDTWRQALPVYSDEAGEAWLTILGSAPGEASVLLLREGAEPTELSLPESIAWSEPVRFDLDAGHNAFDLAIDAPGVTLDQVALSRTRPDLSGDTPSPTVAKFHLTTSHNIIEQCEIYYCCRLDSNEPKSAENRESTICPRLCGEGNVIRLNRIHHTGADAIQPRRGCDGLLIEWNELHGNSEDGIDLKSVTDCTVRYNLIHSNRGGGIVSHDGHHPDPPMYASGNRFYGNIIVGVRRFGLLINDARVVHGDERDAMVAHDNVFVTSEANGIDVNWAKVPVRIEHNLIIGDEPLIRIGTAHTTLSPEGAVARRFNEDVHFAGNVLHALDPDRPMVEAVFRHPEDDLSALGPQLYSPAGDEQVVVHTLRGIKLGRRAPADWLEINAKAEDCRASSEDITLRDMVAQGFVVYECDEPGEWLEMPFTLDEAITGEVYVMLHAYGNRGILRALLDGEPQTDPIDAHVPRPNSRWLVESMGRHDLAGGGHVLRIEVVRRKEDVPTGWIALGGLLIRPEGTPGAAVPVERDWLQSEWLQFVQGSMAAEGSVFRRVEFRDPDRLDYRLTDPELAARFGPRWDEHLDWLTDEQLIRIADPESSFYADHFYWDRSQGPPE